MLNTSFSASRISPGRTNCACSLIINTLCLSLRVATSRKFSVRFLCNLTKLGTVIKKSYGSLYPPLIFSNIFSGLGKYHIYLTSRVVERVAFFLHDLAPSSRGYVKRVFTIFQTSGDGGVVPLHPAYVIFDFEYFFRHYTLENFSIFSEMSCTERLSSPDSLYPPGTTSRSAGSYAYITPPFSYTRSRMSVACKND